MPRILIGALSGANYHDRRERCRKTWMADAATLGVDAFFLMAANDGPRRDGDVLYIPGHDAYAYLPQRTLWFCRYALERDDWEWLFKCDDDTYVCMERLLRAVEAYPPGTEYVGAEWSPGVNYGSGGAGYLMNRRAAAVIARDMLTPIGSEDEMVGRHLRERGFKLLIDERYIPYGNRGGVITRPEPGNEYITLHAVSAETFMETHADVGLEAITKQSVAAKEGNDSERDAASAAGGDYPPGPAGT